MQDSSQPILKVTADTVAFIAGPDSIAGPKKKLIFKSAAIDSSLTKSSGRSINNSAALIKRNTPIVTEQVKPVNFFQGHELKVIHNGPQSLNRLTPDWVFPMLLLIVVAFAWLRTFYNKYFIQIVSAFFNNNLTNQIVRDESILVQRASILLNIVFYLVAALFLYFVSVHFNWVPLGIGLGLSRYIFFALVVSAVYAMKFLILKICGYLFNQSKEMSAYIFNIFLVNNLLGILLIPIVALLAFSTSISMTLVIYISVGFIGIGFLYRIIRGFFIGITSPVFSLYYLFLYLCALEIAPLLVLIKILNPI